jgi:hypothetical protein
MECLPVSTQIQSKRVRLLSRLQDWCTQKAGWVLEKFHSPAKIKEFEYVDPITSESVYLSTGTRYSVLRVGDKHFFFDRLTGRFNGTGTSFKEPVVTGLQLLD